MKRFKKISAVALSIVMLMSVFSFSSLAAGTPNGNEQMIVTIKTDKTEYEPGEQVAVTINIKNNYNATSMRWPILFSTSIFEYVSSTFNLRSSAALKNGSLTSNTSLDASTYVPPTLNSSDYGIILIQWVSNIKSSTVGFFNSTTGNDCITFNLRVKESVNTTTAGKIFISPDSATYPESTGGMFYYQGINTPTEASTIYEMDASTCTLSFVDANAWVIVAEEEEVELVAVDGQNMVIDNTMGYVYGAPLGTKASSMSQYIKATGEGVISYEEIDFGGYTAFGTESKIILKKADGELVREYYYIVFGDLNGDSAWDPLDFLVCDSVAAGYTSFSTDGISPKDFAADLTVDGMIDPLDLMLLDSLVVGSMSIDPTDPLIRYY